MRNPGGNPGRNPGRNSSKKSVKRNRPRRRVTPVWRRRSSRAWAAVIALTIVIGGVIHLWQSGTVERVAGQMKWKMIAVSENFGFTVREILVVGRKETSKKVLRQAVQLVRGAPILAFDQLAAKERLEALPWIRSASVERKLPDTVLINILERRPLALWQYRGRFSLIDYEGKVILRKNLERFSNLLLVVGEDAPQYAADLFQILSTQPEMMAMVSAAVRVGGRRWNLRMENGIDIQLPEKNPSSAWDRLAQYQRVHNILARDIEVLDFRLPDRMTIKSTPPKAGKGAGAGGRET